MSAKGFVGLMLMCLLLASTFACGGGGSKGSGQTLPPLPTSTPTPLPTPTPTLQPTPLNVTLNYIGVEDAHGGNVQLVVVVGDEGGFERTLIPPVEHGFPMGDFETKEINQRVFHTPSAEGSLKMTILAYHRDQSKTDYLALIDMMGWYYGDSINMLRNLVLNMPGNDELIGYYENTWYPDESWGIRQYNEVGIDDLRVWFSIWSDTEPTPILMPSLSPPGGVYEFEVDYSFWPVTSGAYVEFERYLNAGEEVTGFVHWLETYGISYDWSFAVYDQYDNVVLTWSGTDLRYDFSFTASQAGIYTLEVLKRDYLARYARMEIQPPDWTQR